MKNFLFITFLSLNLSAFSQTLWSKFWHLSCAEKKWVFFHPFIAKSVFNISQIAIETTQTLMGDTSLDGDMNGGQLDAFRHAFWMALITKKHGTKKAILLGKAHEKGNYQFFKKNKLEEGSLPDFESSQMDYLNNDVGIEIGNSYNFISNDELKIIIIDMIKEGKLFVLKKDKTGNFIYCDSTYMQSHKKQWVKGKCIVKSNIVRH